MFYEQRFTWTLCSSNEKDNNFNILNCIKQLVRHTKYVLSHLENILSCAS